MKIKIHKWRLELVPLIVTIIAVATLISFGNWQLRRLDEKNQFISTIEANIANPALDLSNFQSSLPTYSKVSISGSFIPNNNVYLYGRRTASPEKDGYYLLSAFSATDGNIYMVSRGWLPHSAKDKIYAPSSLEIETIEGIVLPGERKNFFVPDNDKKNNIWFTLDTEMATQILRTNITDFYIMQINGNDLPEKVLPLTATNLSKVRNDHLEYAITWYSLAVCLLVIFILYSRKQNHKI